MGNRKMARLDRKKILELVKKGVSDAEIARRVGSKNPLTITIIRTQEFGIKYPNEKVDRESIKVLLQRGWDDTRIARHLRVSPHTIGRIRVRELGIHRLRRLDRAIIRSMVNQGMDDARIARELNASPLTIALIRTRDLKIFKPVKPRLDRAALGRYLARGLSDAEIARRIGAKSPSTIAKIRTEEFGISRRTEQIKKIERLVGRGWTDQRIGKQVGRSRKTVQHIRTKILLIKRSTGPKKKRLRLQW